MHPQSLPAIFFRSLLRFCNFSLVLVKCSPILGILSKLKHFLTLNYTGIGELLIVRCGSNLASFHQVVNTVAIDFSADNVSFLDSSHSCKVFRYGLLCHVIFQPVGEM